MAGLLLSIKRGIYITGDLPNVQAGTPVQVRLIVVGAQYGATWTLIGSLPPGWSHESNLGTVVYGVATTPGDYTFSFRVVDGQGRSTTREFTVTITAADALKVTDGFSTTPSNIGQYGTVGEPVDWLMSPFGGVPPYSATYQSGDLAEGLSFSAVTWRITGTPLFTSFVEEEEWLVEDSSVPAQSLVMRLKTVVGPFNIVADPLPAGTRGAYFEHEFGISPGSSEVAWTIPVGTVPDGLHFADLGDNRARISGYPEVTTAGTNITLQADSAAGSTDSEQFTFVINAATITVEQSLPDGRVGEMYVGTLTPSGGYGGYSSDAPVTSGTLPQGLNIGKLKDGTYPITGTPDDDPLNVGDNDFSVTINDAFGNSVVVPCTITIAATELVYVDTDIPTVAFEGEFYHGEFSIAGGLKPYGAFTVVAGTMPPGLSVHADDPWNGRFYFGHVPTVTPEGGGNYFFTLRAQDNQSPPDTADHDFFIRVG